MAFQQVNRIDHNFSVVSSVQVTKGTWRMREQCVPGSLSSEILGTSLRLVPTLLSGCVQKSFVQSLSYGRI